MRMWCGVTVNTGEGLGGGEGSEVVSGAGLELFSGLISHIDTYHLYFQCLPYFCVSM